MIYGRISDKHEGDKSITPKCQKGLKKKKCGAGAVHGQTKLTGGGCAFECV